VNLAAALFKWEQISTDGSAFKNLVKKEAEWFRKMLHDERNRFAHNIICQLRAVNALPLLWCTYEKTGKPIPDFAVLGDDANRIVGQVMKSSQCGAIVECASRPNSILFRSVKAMAEMEWNKHKVGFLISHCNSGWYEKEVSLETVITVSEDPSQRVVGVASSSNSNKRVCNEPANSPQ
jgi:hypothetical protein